MSAADEAAGRRGRRRRRRPRHRGASARWAEMCQEWENTGIVFQVLVKPNSTMRPAVDPPWPGRKAGSEMAALRMSWQ
jgi:hypothetical protein